MKAEKIISIVLTAFVLNFADITKATTVEYNLIDLGCQTFFDINSPSWSVPFDLEETFSDISNFYIDWSGEITAGLGLYYYPDPRVPPEYPPPPPPDDPNVPYPAYVSISVLVNWMDSFYISGVAGGESTYPAAEPFDTFSDLHGYISFVPLDPYIGLYYNEEIIFTQFIQHGSIILNSATLIVEGTTIPEPATLILLCLGTLPLLRKHRKSNLPQF